MYKMPEFTEKDMDAVFAFMQAHPFVTLIGSAGERSAATQVPVLLSRTEQGIIARGHIMRNTGHHKAFGQNDEALLLFTGPHCYVSASWYSQRHIGSTWNYMTVQARGQLVFQNEAETLRLITDLTHAYEDKQAQPEVVEHMPDSYVQPMLKAIVAFEVVLTDIQATFKLSQNRDDESYRNIVNMLWTGEDLQGRIVAKEMIVRRPELFS